MVTMTGLKVALDQFVLMAKKVDDANLEDKKQRLTNVLTDTLNTRVVQKQDIVMKFDCKWALLYKVSRADELYELFYKYLYTIDQADRFYFDELDGQLFVKLS